MELIQSAFDEYVLERYGESFNIKRSARYTRRSALAARFQYLTYAEAGALLGVEPRTLTKLAELHRINRYRSNDSQHWLFSKPEIQALNEIWTQAISLEKACDVLGLPRNLVYRLIDDGFIRAERGPGVDESLEWKLDIRHVEAYLFQVTSRLQPIEVDQNDLIDFSAVIRMLTVLGMNDLSTLEAIRQAELIAYRPSMVDDTQLRLDSILFLEPQVRKFIETVKNKRRWVDRVYISQLMGVKDDVLDLWIHNQLIAPVKTFGNIQYFDVDQVEKFAANFIFTVQAARLLHLSRLTVQRWALNGRLHPISGPHLDGGPDYLFRRSEIKAWQQGAYLTAPALARYLQVSHSQLLQWVKAGKIRPISGPGVDQSKHYRFVLTEAVYGLRRHVSE
ncbi:MAG: helix-turn-helix domain-containing protein [Chloroflexota bacterium]